MSETEKLKQPVQNKFKSLSTKNGDNQKISNRQLPELKKQTNNFFLGNQSHSSFKNENFNNVKTRIEQSQLVTPVWYNQKGSKKFNNRFEAQKKNSYLPLQAEKSDNEEYDKNVMMENFLNEFRTAMERKVTEIQVKQDLFDKFKKQQEEKESRALNKSVQLQFNSQQKEDLFNYCQNIEDNQNSIKIKQEKDIQNLKYKVQDLQKELTNQATNQHIIDQNAKNLTNINPSEHTSQVMIKTMMDRDVNQRSELMNQLNEKFLELNKKILDQEKRFNNKLSEAREYSNMQQNQANEKLMGMKGNESMVNIGENEFIKRKLQQNEENLQKEITHRVEQEIEQNNNFARKLEIMKKELIQNVNQNVNKDHSNLDHVNNSIFSIQKIVASNKAELETNLKQTQVLFQENIKNLANQFQNTKSQVGNKMLQTEQHNASIIQEFQLLKKQLFEQQEFNTEQTNRQINELKDVEIKMENQLNQKERQIMEKIENLQNNDSQRNKYQEKRNLELFNEVNIGLRALKEENEYLKKEMLNKHKETNKIINEYQVLNKELMENLEEQQKQMEKQFSYKLKTLEQNFNDNLTTLQSNLFDKLKDSENEQLLRLNRGLIEQKSDLLAYIDDQNLLFEGRIIEKLQNKIYQMVQDINMQINNNQHEILSIIQQLKENIKQRNEQNQILMDKMQRDIGYQAEDNLQTKIQIRKEIDDKLSNMLNVVFADTDNKLINERKNLEFQLQIHQREFQKEIENAKVDMIVKFEEVNNNIIRDFDEKIHKTLVEQIQPQIQNERNERISKQQEITTLIQSTKVLILEQMSQNLESQKSLFKSLIYEESVERQQKDEKLLEYINKQLQVLEINMQQFVQTECEKTKFELRKEIFELENIVNEFKTFTLQQIQKLKDMDQDLWLNFENYIYILQTEVRYGFNECEITFQNVSKEILFIHSEFENNKLFVNQGIQRNTDLVHDNQEYIFNQQTQLNSQLLLINENQQEFEFFKIQNKEQQDEVQGQINQMDNQIADNFQKFEEYQQEMKDKQEEQNEDLQNNMKQLTHQTQLNNVLINNNQQSIEENQDKNNDRIRQTILQLINLRSEYNEILQQHQEYLNRVDAIVYQNQLENKLMLENLNGDFEDYKQQMSQNNEQNNQELLNQVQSQKNDMNQFNNGLQIELFKHQAQQRLKEEQLNTQIVKINGQTLQLIESQESKMLFNLKKLQDNFNQKQNQNQDEVEQFFNTFQQEIQKNLQEIESNIQDMESQTQKMKIVGQKNNNAMIQELNSEMNQKEQKNKKELQDLQDQLQKNIQEKFSYENEQRDQKIEKIDVQVQNNTSQIQENSRNIENNNRNIESNKYRPSLKSVKSIKSAENIKDDEVKELIEQNQEIYEERFQELERNIQENKELQEQMQQQVDENKNQIEELNNKSVAPVKSQKSIKSKKSIVSDGQTKNSVNENTNERIDELQEQIDELNNKINAFDPEALEKLNNLEEIQEKLENIDPDQQEKNAKIEELAEKIEAFDPEILEKLNDIETIQEKLEQIDVNKEAIEEFKEKIEQFEGIEEKLEKLDKLDEYEEQLQKLEQFDEVMEKLEKLDEVEEQINGAKEQLEELAEMKEQLEGIAEMKEKLEQIEENIEKIGDVGEITEKIEKVEEMVGDFEELKTNVEAIQESLEPLKEINPEDIQEKIETITGQVEEIKEAAEGLASISEKIEAIEEKFPELEEKLEKVDEMIEGAEELKEKLQEMAGQIEALEEKD